jgi:hypothetical protein
VDLSCGAFESRGQLEASCVIWVEEGGRGQSIINSIHMYLDSMEIVASWKMRLGQTP